MKKLLGAAVAVFVCVAMVFAAEYKGKVKEYKKGTITITVKDKDTEIAVGKETKLFDADGKEVTGKDRGKALKDLKDKEVTIITDKVDGKETAKEIKVKK